MVRHRMIYALVIIALLVVGNELLARGGRGGGGGGGRGGGGFSGGGRPSGGFSGGGRPSGGFSGGARPSPSINRSPSMSRMPSASSRPSQPRTATAARPSQLPARSATAGRPSQLPARSATAGRPSQLPSRPSAGVGSGNRGLSTGIAAGVGAAGGALAGQAAFRDAGSFNRPSQGQLNDFLGMPREGVAGASAGSRNSASQLPGGDGTRSFTTERGTTITVGGQGGSKQIGDATVGGGVGGIKVETAGGGTYGKVAGGVGVAGESGAAARGGSISGAQTSRGSIANVSRGYADTAGNRAGGSATVAQNRAGYTAANVRGGVSSGGVTRVGSASAVRGPRGNVVAAGRGAAFVNGQFVGGRSWAAVNGNFTRWNYFSGNWNGRYPGAWWPGKWAVWGTAWAVATWPYASAYCGCADEPCYYDYGGNVAYDEGMVYADDQPIATAEEYYAQAEELAASGEEAKNEEWMPLGIFAVITDENQTNTDKLVQLAINRDGVIRGNFHDILTDDVSPLIGAVDKKTQRVSIKPEGKEHPIVETGLYNLTNDEAPVLVHFSAERREGRVFIRLKKPEENAPPAAPPTN
jgi:hypothetical protein